MGGEEAVTGGEERIYVSVRLRPLNDKERAKNDVSDWECINNTTVIHRNNISASDRSLYPTAYTFGKKHFYFHSVVLFCKRGPRKLCVLKLHCSGMRV